METVQLRETFSDRAYEVELHKSLEKTQRILLLEDDAQIKALFKAILKRAAPGVNIEWVTFAEDALGVLRSAAEEGEPCPYLLAIADVYLAGPTDGLQFWNEVKDLYPDLPIIVTSGMSSLEFWSRREVQVTSPTFLEKPFYIKDCRELIQLLMNNSTLA